MAVTQVGFFKYYPVKGKTKDEIIASMNAGAPVVNGQKYRAYTTWRVTYLAKFKESKGFVILDKYTINVDSSIKLPKWDDINKAPTELKRQWETYITNLKNHELGHKEIALSAANFLNGEFKKIAPGKTSADITFNLDTLLSLTLAGFKVVEDNYDKATQHGRTQGAYFV